LIHADVKRANTALLSAVCGHSQESMITRVIDIFKRDCRDGSPQSNH
jgi:hypothetical protein